MKRFLRVAALCALALLAAALPAFGAEADDRHIVVEVEALGKDQVEAVNNAWREAILQASGAFIDSKTELKDDQITERIISYSRGMVEKYEVVAADATRAGEGIYKVKIRAWVVRDLLRDGVKVATNKTAEMDVSMEDLAPPKEELDAAAIASQDARAVTRQAQAETGVELLSAMLARYNPADFIDSRMTGRVKLVPGKEEELCEVPLEVSFNQELYEKKFIPDLVQVLDQIATKKRDVTLTKQRDVLRRLANK